MGSCTIIKSGAMTSLQDDGRSGYAHFAIPRGGVMDKTAANYAHNLVGNPTSLPIIECTLKGPSIKFASAALIALTGADMQWKLNGALISRNKSIVIAADDLLSSGYTKNSLRAYLAIQGEIETTFHFDSCSSYAPAQLGHNKGIALANGDILNWKTNPNTLPTLTYPGALTIPKEILLLKGPEYAYLTPQSIQKLTTQRFKVGPDSNRMGARLIGPKLDITDILTNSVPVLPGIIQLPPSGQPIVVLQDGQTTGGYPRIAYIDSMQLSGFNRLPIGQEFTFKLSQ